MRNSRREFGRYNDLLPGYTSTYGDADGLGPEAAAMLCPAGSTYSIANLVAKRGRHVDGPGEGARASGSRHCQNGLWYRNICYRCLPPERTKTKERGSIEVEHVRD